MPHVRSGDARAHQMHGLTFRPLATPSLGSPQLSVWELEVPPGASGPAHAMTRDEIFVVQHGRFSAVVGGEQADLLPGDALTVPSGKELRLSNPHGEPARALVCALPDMQAVIEGRAVSPPWVA